MWTRSACTPSSRPAFGTLSLSDRTPTLPALPLFSACNRCLLPAQSHLPFCYLLPFSQSCRHSLGASRPSDRIQPQTPSVSLLSVPVSHTASHSGPSSSALMFNAPGSAPARSRPAVQSPATGTMSCHEGALNHGGVQEHGPAAWNGKPLPSVAKLCAGAWASCMQEHGTAVLWSMALSRSTPVRRSPARQHGPASP